MADGVHGLRDRGILRRRVHIEGFHDEESEKEDSKSGYGFESDASFSD